MLVLQAMTMMRRCCGHHYLEMTRWRAAYKAGLSRVADWDLASERMSVGCPWPITGRSTGHAMDTSHCSGGGGRSVP